MSSDLAMDPQEQELERQLYEARRMVEDANGRPPGQEVTPDLLVKLRNDAHRAWRRLEEYRDSKQGGP